MPPNWDELHGGKTVVVAGFSPWGSKNWPFY